MNNIDRYGIMLFTFQRDLVQYRVQNILYIILELSRSIFSKSVNRPYAHVSKCYIQIAATLYLPHQVKTQYLHFRFHANYFPLPWKIPEGISRRSISSITKGSIYHIKHMYIQHFAMGEDWPEIERLMEVSTMFYICRYCVFTWYGRYKKRHHRNDVIKNVTRETWMLKLFFFNDLRKSRCF